MKLAESLEAFKKLNSKEEWYNWLENYRATHNCYISGNFFMDRYSYYDFKRSKDDCASIKQLIAFEEYGEFYVLKEEYC